MKNNVVAATIISFVAEADHVASLKQAAEANHFTLRQVKDANDIGAATPHAPVERPGEALYGQKGFWFSC